MKKEVSLMRDVFIVFLTIMINGVALYFAIISLDFLPFSLVKNNKIIVSTILLASILVLFVVFALFYRLKHKVVYKSFFLVSTLLLVAIVSYYFLSTTRVLEKFKTIEDFREYVSSFGSKSIIIFITLQFLQVVILPIPSLVTTGAGVLLYGPFKGAMFSVIGIVLGSIFAFFIGRVFGFKAVKWLVGEESLDKALKAVSKTDKILLAFMFLFPFFPDDLICFVSGLTTITPLYFILTVLITRSIAVTFSSFSINNNLIPFDTWWGILLWIIFFIFTMFLTLYVSKNGDKIKLKSLKLKNKIKLEKIK